MKHFEQARRQPDNQISFLFIFYFFAVVSSNKRLKTQTGLLRFFLKWWQAAQSKRINIHIS